MACSEVAVPLSSPEISRPSFDLTGKHYIVTGGTQGLGLEVARQLRDCGAAKAVLLSRTRSKGEAAEEELRSPTFQAHFVMSDMEDPKSLAAAVASAIGLLDDRVDGLVNAAANTERGNLMETTAEMFDRQFAINTRAPFLLTQAVAKHMISCGTRGSIVNISSVTAKGGAPFITAYSGSKAALNNVAQNNAAELAPHGIRVNTVNMGWTVTENEHALQAKIGGENWLEAADKKMLLNRLLRPADVACTVLFLLSPASTMMTGHTMDLHPDNWVGLISTKTADCVDR